MDGGNVETFSPNLRQLDRVPRHGGGGGGEGGGCRRRRRHLWRVIH